MLLDCARQDFGVGRLKGPAVEIPIERGHAEAEACCCISPEEAKGRLARAPC